MNLCGIIVEYNPFHNGHMLHINKAKELSRADGTIAVMSGNFCQRGDFSVIDKFAKAEIAINHGVDLVVELPYLYATQNASKFAYGAINVLKACHINHLVFGSETNDIEILKDIASTEINPDHLKVPTVAELKKDAERLLKSAMRFAKANRRCKFYMTATGPFKASYRYGIIELECIFTSWSCD